MSPLLEQYIAESRECLAGISNSLLKLERTPDDAALLDELFRLVHTLKGNSALFDFQEMSRVLHAGEDLLDAVRKGQVQYSRVLADQLLAAADFVERLCDDIVASRAVDAGDIADSVRLAAALREMLGASDDPASEAFRSDGDPQAGKHAPPVAWLSAIPEPARIDAYRLARDGAVVHAVEFTPQEDCFYQGDDPFFTARQTPQLIWSDMSARAAWPDATTFDAFRCMLDFRSLSIASREDISQIYRYVADDVVLTAIDPTHFVVATGDRRSDPVVADFSTLARGMLDRDAWDELRAAVAERLADYAPTWRSASVARWMAVLLEVATVDKATLGGLIEILASQAPPSALYPDTSTDRSQQRQVAREAGETSGVLKVDQHRIDRLMNLVGEMIVAKNALPYLADRAERHGSGGEIARDLKEHYSVVNRITDELQDAVMQIRMMPISSIVQRFPRLVRDISHKLGKQVELALEGEETEADKTIVESLADPLIHILRNSLDHGLERPEDRVAAGKAATGRIVVAARQDGNRVHIVVSDDGRGIDPAVIKRKACEKGILSPADAEQISDREAMNLVFAAGFSTADVISDLSGRGVGMDVVRSAVEKVHGTIELDSELGKGTHIRISLPLSMAVTQVIIVKTDGQLFGVPTEAVIETVRVARSATLSVNGSEAIMLRDRVIPLRGLNRLLGLNATPIANRSDEIAVLVTVIGGHPIGLVVDEFREIAAVIQKPLAGVLARVTAYSGSALMGDGGVLMVLSLRELM